jgi:hypothetical protein
MFINFKLLIYKKCVRNSHEDGLAGWRKQRMLNLPETAWFENVQD